MNKSSRNETTISSRKIAKFFVQFAVLIAAVAILLVCFAQKSCSQSPEMPVTVPEHEVPEPELPKSDEFSASELEAMEQEAERQKREIELIQVRSCLEDMVACCTTGNVESGRYLEQLRISAQNDVGDTSPVVHFDELFLLAKIIHAEAGSSWIPLEWRMKVGEVVLNRVASPEFPDTIHDVVYQKNQYSPVKYDSFKTLLPDGLSAEAAARLLTGERLLNNPAVVFQAGFRQGSGVHEILRDKKLGNTYLCYSEHPELYKEG